MTKVKTVRNVLAKPKKDFWDIGVDGITQSFLGTFMTCQEKARLRMVEGLTPMRVSGALAFGSLFHEGLDRVYNQCKHFWDNGKQELTPIPENLSGMVTDIMRSIYQRDRKAMRSALADVGIEQEFERNFGLAEIMMQAYVRRWDKDFHDLRWMDIERVFEVPYHLTVDYGHSDMEPMVTRKVPVRGKFDGVYRDKAKGLWLFETKTKSHIDDPVIADKMGYELQVMLYLWAMNRVYEEVPKGVLYNLVRRPLLVHGKRESLAEYLERVRSDVTARPDHYFIRYNVSITWAEVAEWVKEFDGMVQNVYRWSQGEFHYKNSQECNGRYGTCEFLPVCARGDRSRFTLRGTVFQELAMVGEEEV